MAGFDATGLELSPSIAEWASSTFGVPILVGPIEDQTALVPQAHDVIVMMDVLEHLPDPLATVGRCVELLRPDGVLLIQTPRFRGESYKSLVDRDEVFLSQLKELEHLFLFTETSVQTLLTAVGLDQICLEDPIFPYDMLIVAGRGNLEPVDEATRDAALETSASGRWIRALCDLYTRTEFFERVAHERLETIEALDEKLQAFIDNPIVRAARSMRNALRQRVQPRDRGDSHRRT